MCGVVTLGLLVGDVSRAVLCRHEEGRGRSPFGERLRVFVEQGSFRGPTCLSVTSGPLLVDKPRSAEETPGREAGAKGHTRTLNCREPKASMRHNPEKPRNGDERGLADLKLPPSGHPRFRRHIARLIASVSIDAVRAPHSSSRRKPGVDDNM